jgi:hypothetical protein
MKLIELVKYLCDREKLSELYQEQGLDIEAEGNFAYMRGELDIKSEIFFFTDDETGGALFFEKGGVAYIDLFELEYATNLIEELDLKDKGYSDLEIARRLLEYRIYDA